MSATPHRAVDGNFDRCPICKGDPKGCPHSFADMADRVWDTYVRKIVRDELRKHA